jgi:hypothetical protein
MNALVRRPRASGLRRMALTLALGLSFLAPVQAFALTIIRTTTIYYVLGIEVWRTVTVTVVADA